MKKLCFIMYRFEVGGCESVFIELAKTMTDEIELITVVPQMNVELLESLPPNVTVIKHDEIPILKTISKTVIKNNAILYSLLSMTILPYYLKKRNRNINTVYVNFSDTLSSLYIAVKTGKRKAISWLQCRPKELMNSKSYRRYIKYMHKCKKIVCICKSQKKEFLEMTHGFKESSFDVIYNPIDIIRINELKKYPINEEKPYICMVSRLDERSKDFHTAIDAYSILSEDLKSKYSLQIIGDGPDREKIQEYICKKHLQDNVFLKGSDTNPYKWMANSEVFLFSSKNEGLGLVILEALACGKMVIATDCPVGPREILNDRNECGKLIPVGDADIMSVSLADVLTNRIDKNYYLKNATSRIEDFSIRCFKKRLVDLFD